VNLPTNRPTRLCSVSSRQRPGSDPHYVPYYTKNHRYLLLRCYLIVKDALGRQSPGITGVGADDAAAAYCHRRPPYHVKHLSIRHHAAARNGASSNSGHHPGAAVHQALTVTVMNRSSQVGDGRAPAGHLLGYGRSGEASMLMNRPSQNRAQLVLENRCCPWAGCAAGKTSSDVSRRSPDPRWPRPHQHTCNVGVLHGIGS